MNVLENVNSWLLINICMCLLIKYLQLHIRKRTKNSKY